jgi:hypothetical protein
MMHTPVSPLRVLAKGLLLFVLFNLVFAAWEPAHLGGLTLYGSVFPGRLRLPFGEDSQHAYNLSLYNLDAMFNSLAIAGRGKPAGEYRVIVIGDSSVWGILLRPEQTLAGQLQAENLTACDGRQIRVYNLGYPTISLTKDLMILSYAMRYQPDLVVWPITLEAFPLDQQLNSPLVANNAAVVQGLIREYRLPLNPQDPALVQANFWQRTLIGQRRSLADLIRLQLYGVMWAATGIDQTYPTDYPPAQTDFGPDASFNGVQGPVLDQTQLPFEVLSAGVQAVGNTPLLLVNEPILVSTGKNSDLRYNFFYPRWAYDQYRLELSHQSAQHGWNYLDEWNLVPANEFTNSAIHLTSAGESLLVKQVESSVLSLSCR